MQNKGNAAIGQTRSISPAPDLLLRGSLNAERSFRPGLTPVCLGVPRCVVFSVSATAVTVAAETSRSGWPGKRAVQHIPVA